MVSQYAGSVRPRCQAQYPSDLLTTFPSQLNTVYLRPGGALLIQPSLSANINTSDHALQLSGRRCGASNPRFRFAVVLRVHPDLPKRSV